jgi:hypothetical protein
MIITIVAIRANRVVPSDVVECGVAEVDACEIHIAQIGTIQVGAWSQQIAVTQGSPQAESPVEIVAAKVWAATACICWATLVLSDPFQVI